MTDLELEQYLTPHKLGEPVLAGSGVEGDFDALAVDCPFVFEHTGAFHMMFIGFDGKGYQTGLARSMDLIHWDKLGVILARGEATTGIASTPPAPGCCARTTSTSHERSASGRRGIGWLTTPIPARDTR